MGRPLRGQYTHHTQAPKHARLDPRAGRHLCLCARAASEIRPAGCSPSLSIAATCVAHHSAAGAASSSAAPAVPLRRLQLSVRVKPTRSSSASVPHAESTFLTFSQRSDPGDHQRAMQPMAASACGWTGAAHAPPLDSYRARDWISAAGIALGVAQRTLSLVCSLYVPPSASAASSAATHLDCIVTASSAAP